jgi:hypothetical protein
MCVINYMEMARVTGVPLSYLQTRGQQIKVISQLLRWVLVERISLQILASVGDPDPDSQYPHVLGPPGSGSISQRYESGPFPFLIKVLSGLK